MRASSILACGAPVLAAVAAVACAASGNESDTTLSPDSGSRETPIPDGGERPVVDADIEASAKGPLCSADGWCATSLPDVDLTMRNIWPLAGHAFAVAVSPTLGAKVLEWNDSEGSWKYIDDGTQNEPGMGDYVGIVWAPNVNEVYYGVAPGYIYHGTRPESPQAAWSWTRHRLGDGGDSIVWATGTTVPALGVWGTSASDVYAWFTNTIYHWKSVDGGTPTWVSEYVADDADDPSERLLILGAAGTSADDIWFSGVRSYSYQGCAIALRKTAAEYRRITDGVLATPYGPCTARAGAALLGGAEGALTSIQASAKDAIVGLKGERDVVRISVDGDSYSFAVSPVPPALGDAWTSLWKGPDALWLSGIGGNVSGRVIRGSDAPDGGGYEISRISLFGGPFNETEFLYQVRGTENTNLWAIGSRYALHKTTP